MQKPSSAWERPGGQPDKERALGGHGQQEKGEEGRRQKKGILRLEGPPIALREIGPGRGSGEKGY
jgi:hypothetical protein